MKLYDLKNVLCTVGGATISGYGEEDALRFEWASDLVVQTVCADGSTVLTRSKDRRLTAILTLMQTSGAIPLLRASLELQHGDSSVPLPTMLPIPFYMLDPTLGDFVTGGCVFLNRPDFGKRRTVGEIEFRLLLPSPVWQLGSFNTP